MEFSHTQSRLSPPKDTPEACASCIVLNHQSLTSYQYATFLGEISTVKCYADLAFAWMDVPSPNDDRKTRNCESRVGMVGLQWCNDP